MLSAGDDVSIKYQPLTIEVPTFVLFFSLIASPCLGIATRALI
jgi:hypothetical protein